MKITFRLLFTLFISFCMMTLAACDNQITSNEKNTTEDNELDILDYTLPDNFFMSIQISDTSIFDKGDPWYYKTAKIGNDWQLIEYDRDLDNLAEQATHFFKYLSEDSYKHYTYNHTEETWIEVDTVSFHEMVFTSPNNFKFLYTKPTETQYSIEETSTSYDCDPTSNNSFREAVKYEYTSGLDIQIIVDSEYSNMILSEVDRDESRICISWRAYEFNLTISSWSNSYLSYKDFKDFTL